MMQSFTIVHHRCRSVGPQQRLTADHPQEMLDAAVFPTTAGNITNQRNNQWRSSSYIFRAVFTSSKSEMCIYVHIIIVLIPITIFIVLSIRLQPCHMREFTLDTLDNSRYSVKLRLTDERTCLFICLLCGVSHIGYSVQKNPGKKKDRKGKDREQRTGSRIKSIKTKSVYDWLESSLWLNERIWDRLRERSLIFN